MKLKCKKIRNVEKNICTCEQKIAYNFAFSNQPQLKKCFDSNMPTANKLDFLQEIITNIIIPDCTKWNDNLKKYNVDAIVHAFRNGVQEYLKGSIILTSYEDIGINFPILYEIA